MGADAAAIAVGTDACAGVADCDCAATGAGDDSTGWRMVCRNGDCSTGAPVAGAAAGADVAGTAADGVAEAGGVATDADASLRGVGAGVGVETAGVLGWRLSLIGVRFAAGAAAGRTGAGAAAATCTGLRLGPS